jgi:squalene-hopene/tetraprenyl-beta-curcumene cyclase
MMEAGEPRDGEPVKKAMDWMADRQILDVVGDWAQHRPGLRPGGWAFQYENAHYPDVDDSAVVAMALGRAGDPKYKEGLERAIEWIIGMQCKNGGWGSFDAENTHYYFNHIPFADHGALLDPPTEDVTARYVSMLAQLDHPSGKDAIARGLAYLRALGNQLYLRHMVRTMCVQRRWRGPVGTAYPKSYRLVEDEPAR